MLESSIRGNISTFEKSTVGKKGYTLVQLRLHVINFNHLLNTVPCVKFKVFLLFLKKVNFANVHHTMSMHYLTYPRII